MTALAFTIAAFLSRNDGNPESFISKIFFFMFGGISWMAFSIGSFKQYFIWGGQENMVDYMFLPVNGEESLAWIYAAMGIVMIIIGLFKILQFAGDMILVESKQALR